MVKKKTSKGENKAFPSPSSPCNVVPLVELLIENNKHPNFEQWGVQCLNNFVAECRFG